MHIRHHVCSAISCVVELNYYNFVIYKILRYNRKGFDIIYARYKIIYYIMKKK